MRKTDPESSSITSGHKFCMHERPRIILSDDADGGKYEIFRYFE